MADLPSIERLQAVTIEPGDVIVVTLPARTPDDFAGWVDDIQAAMAKKFPGHKVLIVSAGVEVSVMRPEEASSGD